MKQRFFKLTGVFFLLLLVLNGCTKDPVLDPVVSVGKQINYFKVTTPATTGVIDTVAKTVVLSFPAGTALTALVTDISLAAGHTISPASGVAQNLTTPVTFTITRPDKTTTTWTVSAKFLDITINQDITASATWTADKTYIISGDVTVGNNSVITIEAGTVIKFDAGASLSIGYSSNATFIANGTAAKPIIFKSSALSPAAGAWEGLYFYSYTLNNSSLAYCNIEYAGSSTSYGAVNLLGCDLAINNCNINNSGSYGIYTSFVNNKGGFVTFANNTLTNTVKYGIVLNAQKVGLIGTGNTFTNTIGLLITGDYNNNVPTTWRKLNTPYIVDSELDIDGNLTIEAGTTFKCTSGAWIVVGYYASTTFIADGTSGTTPITFTSTAAAPTAGAWKGITFYGLTQTNTKMNFCIVEFAGSDTFRGAVTLLSTSSITYTNNIVRNSAGYGVWAEYGAGFQLFNNNTINTCVNHVIVISTLHLPNLGSPNTLTPGAGKGIEFTGAARYIGTAVTWKKQTADFYVSGGENDVDGDLTIEPGCKFMFVNDSYFWFGYYATTKITAVGTANSKITFTSAASSPVAGAWRGLIFDSFTQVNSALTYCDFFYTGMVGKAAIDNDVSFPVYNTTVNSFNPTSHAGEYRIGNAVPAGNTTNNFTWFAN
jgi:hypothetical protein